MTEWRQLERAMRMRVMSIMLVILAVPLAACDWMPGKPRIEDRELRPDEVMDFGELYAHYCSACHGADGTKGPATPLRDPTYLSWVGKQRLAEIIAKGVPNTAMPGFAHSAGGTLTAAQLKVLGDEIVARWGGSDAPQTKLPPYSVKGSPSATDPAPNRGAAVYQQYCAHCHGPDGRGGDKAGSVVNDSYLALVSDQGLRTIVVAGRVDLGMPNWAGYRKGQTMSDTEISDVVAWLISHRRPFPGQPYETAPPTTAPKGVNP